MRALVHIGMPKTGTTTLQNALWSARRTLGERGVFYRRYSPYGNQPELLMAVLERLGRSLALPQFALGLRNWNAAARSRRGALFERRLAADLAATNCETVVFSCEELGHFHRGPKFIEALHGWLCERFSEVRYLVFLRQQVETVESGYSEVVRLGSTQDMAAYVQAQKSLDLNALVRRWEQVVGPDNLAVHLYENGAGDPAAVLWAELGLKDSERPAVGQRNLRLSARHLRIRLWCNRLVARVLPGPVTRHVATTVLASLLCAVIPAGAKRVTLSADQRADVLARTAASNEALRRRRFPKRAQLFAATAPAAAPSEAVA